jgi:hypothetical protein
MMLAAVLVLVLGVLAIPAVLHVRAPKPMPRAERDAVAANSRELA